MWMEIIMSGNLYDYLKKEHMEVLELFRITLDQKIQSYYPEIKEKLCKHMDNEEKYLYPSLEVFDKITILEGYEEHAIAKRLINDLDLRDQYDEKWVAKAKVLNEIIKHHIKEEETYIFKIAEKILNKDDELKILNQIQ
jgi:hemerythrin-like domain-containing protein